LVEDAINIGLSVLKDDMKQLHIQLSAEIDSQYVELRLAPICFNNIQDCLWIVSKMLHDFQLQNYNLYTLSSQEIMH